MTENESNNNIQGDDEKGVAEQVADEPVDTQAIKNENKEKNKEKTKTPGRLIIYPLYLLFLLLIGAGLALAYLGWQKAATLSDNIDNLSAQITAQKNAATTLQTSQENFVLLSAKRETTITNRLQAAEQRLQAQHKKLMSMSSTSREDWLLAEAEYLLRLANQRVLIERSPRSADGLLTQADEILRNLDDPDLFSLRQAIANDLAKLRLVQEIDHEGIYFSLSALAAEVEALGFRPSRAELLGSSNKPGNQAEVNAVEEPAANELVEEQSRWRQFWRSFKETFSFLNDYISLRKHDNAPTVLLPPHSAMYLQQNLRMKIERAQLALLREEQAIYESSLQEARNWVSQYYPQSQSVSAFAEQLLAFQQLQIVQTLPDITQSLELLHDYIQNLHKLDGVGNTPSSAAGADK